MTEPESAASVATSHCPWCSTEVAPDTATCPNCGAKLRDEASADIPGVTQIDQTATVVRPQPRARSLLGWISGEVDTTETDLDRAGIEPPTEAVRQEMLRLEMEALRAEIDAEAAAQALDRPEGPAVAPRPPDEGAAAS